MSKRQRSPGFISDLVILSIIESTKVMHDASILNFHSGSATYSTALKFSSNLSLRKNIDERRVQKPMCHEFTLDSAYDSILGIFNQQSDFDWSE